MPNPDDVQLATNEVRGIAERIRDFSTVWKRDDGLTTDNSLDFAIAEALQKLARSVDLLAARVERCEARIARVR